jgi:hypothetical protein
VRNDEHSVNHCHCKAAARVEQREPGNEPGNEPDNDRITNCELRWDCETHLQSVRRRFLCWQCATAGE